MARPPAPGGLPRKPATALSRPAARSRYALLLHDAARFFETKDYDTAFSIYRQALAEAPPGDEQALKGLARCYRKQARKALRQEDFAQVASLLEAMLALPQVPAKALDYKVLGEACLELGRLPEARAALEQALALDAELAGETRRLFTRLRTEELAEEMKGLH